MPTFCNIGIKSELYCLKFRECRRRGSAVELSDRSACHIDGRGSEGRTPAACWLTVARRPQHYGNVLTSVVVLSLALFLRRQTRGSMVHTWSSVRPEHA